MRLIKIVTCFFKGIFNNCFILNGLIIFTLPQNLQLKMIINEKATLVTNYRPAGIWSIILWSVDPIWSDITNPIHHLGKKKTRNEFQSFYQLILTNTHFIVYYLLK